MSNVWFAIPSCRPAGGTIPAWRSAGYRIAVLRQNEPIEADIQIRTGEYLGWARSVNILAKTILRVDKDAQWIVSGGDDTLPDPNHAPEEIAAQCSTRFSKIRLVCSVQDGTVNPQITPCTFGVMQCTGDRWGDDAGSRAMFGEDRGAIIDRIAGSPWMGREWCAHAYQGNGPMFEGHYHCYSDEELALVAEKMGVYWRRRDLTHLHQHWLRDNNNLTGRTDEPQSWAIASKDYMQGRALFEERKRLGFPGSSPLPIG